MRTLSIPVRTLAEAVQGEIIGDADLEIRNIQGLEQAEPGDISFLSNPKYFRFVANTRASALIVGRDFHRERTDLTLIVVDDPYRAFIRILRLLRPEHEEFEPGIADSARIDPDAVIGEGVMIGHNVVIGPGCRVGDGTMIQANTVLLAEVHIGADSCIYPGVTFYPRCRVGDRVVIHSGSVIGADGFGFTRGEEGAWEKIPQTGSVVIEDDVEIGACVTIDRGTLGETRVCRGVKMDNLIHLAHNVRVGENTVIAAQTGISGSTMIGQANMIAGQVGIVGHIETTTNVIIEAQSGVSKSILKPGRYFGHPAKEHALALRQEGALRQLPDLLAEIRTMRRQIRELQEALGVSEGAVDTEEAKG